MADYKPTVYEQIVWDFFDGKELKYDDYKEELIARGWGEKCYFDAYVKDMKYIKSLMDSPDFNLRAAADVVKKKHPSADNNVLYFSLTDKEKQIVLAAEQKGMFKDGEVIEYEGYKRKIEAHDYHHLPEKTDAFVIFSGHPGSAQAAMEAWFEDYKHTGNPKKLVFLGLYDNQGNTDFSQKGLKFNTGSEVEMYVRQCREYGISEDIIKECLVTPTDTSTEDNIVLLAEIRNKFFDRKKDANFVMFGYPAYQKRIASEFSYKFQRMEDDREVAPTNFIMPVVNPEKNPKERYLSYDNLDGIAQDIIIGNCLAHPYRGGDRYDSKLGKYPKELKSLLPLSLVYSYPNVYQELAYPEAKDDPELKEKVMKVGTMMKLLRAVQHEVYGWEKAKHVDNTIMYNIQIARMRLAHKGLLSAKVAFHGNEQSKRENLRNIKKTKRNYEDEAKIILGSDHPKPEKLRGVVEYLKHQDNQK